MTIGNINVDISLQCPLWRDIFPEYNDHIAACLGQIASHVPEAENFNRISHLEVSILLGDDNYIRQLNREYRGQDEATNVLSFPSLCESEIDNFLIKSVNIPEFPIALGDMVLAFETIEREARDQGKGFSGHFCHLCLHGILHLLGYDHIEPDQRQRMEALEKKLLAELSIDDPYGD